MTAKRTAILIAALLAFLTPAGIAHAATLVTPSATTVTAGDTVTISIDGAVTLTENGLNYDPTGLYGGRITGACTATTGGSYTSGGQWLSVVCTGPGTLTAQASGTFTLNGDAGQVVTVTTTPRPVVTPPPPAPAPKITAVTSTCSGTYSVAITNSGNADAVNISYSDSYCTPPSLAAVVAPAGTTVSYRTICNRLHHCYQSNGFVVKGLNVPVGATVTIYFTL